MFRWSKPTRWRNRYHNERLGEAKQSDISTTNPEKVEVVRGAPVCITMAQKSQGQYNRSLSKEVAINPKDPRRYQKLNTNNETLTPYTVQIKKGYLQGQNGDPSRPEGDENNLRTPSTPRGTNHQKVHRKRGHHTHTHTHTHAHTHTHWLTRYLQGRKSQSKKQRTNEANQKNAINNWDAESRNRVATRAKTTNRWKRRVRKAQVPQKRGNSEAQTTAVKQRHRNPTARRAKETGGTLYKTKEWRNKTRRRTDL